jgi:putative ABC transport system permease protein
MRVSASFFNVFGMKAHLGRTFIEGEDTLGNERVLVISHGLWQSRFSGDAEIVGRTVTLNDELYQIVGVLPRGVLDRENVQIWRPLAFSAGDRSRTFSFFLVYARLKAGVTVEQAQAQMRVISERITRNNADARKGWGAIVEPYEAVQMDPRNRRSGWILFGAVAMVLLIACVNLANLNLTRGLSRERELAVRASLGAGRSRLLRQLVVESLLVSLGGAISGLGLCFTAVRVLNRTIPTEALPYEANVSVDGRVVAFTTVLALVTTLICGLLPALRTTKVDLTSATKSGGTGGSHHFGLQRARSLLIVSQVALAFVLIAGAGLLLRTLGELHRVKLGFDPANVLTAGFPLAKSHSTSAEAVTSYLSEVEQRVAAIPGVRDVAFSSSLPLAQHGWGLRLRFHRDDRERPLPDARPLGGFKMVSPSYFRSLEITLLKGRTFQQVDGQGAPRVIVINQTLADRLFPDEDPVGKQLVFPELLFQAMGVGEEASWRIIGVIADERVDPLDARDPLPGVYMTLQQTLPPGGRFQVLLVRGTMEPTRLFHAIRDAVVAVNKDQVFENVKTLSEVRGESINGYRMFAAILAVFAGVSLLLAALGVYGVVSHGVHQRTREIGIRSALGATPVQIVRRFLAAGMSTVAVGIAVGFIGALGLNQLLRAFLFGVSERDPATLAGGAIVLAAVALLATYIPARRAARIDPVVALRAE